VGRETVKRGNQPVKPSPGAWGGLGPEIGGHDGIAVCCGEQVQIGVGGLAVEDAGVRVARGSLDVFCEEAGARAGGARHGIRQGGREKG
jgi:hypothetical protein